MTEADLILLQRYIDGELDAAETERVRIRIANSPEWQRAEEELLDDLAHVSLLMANVDRTGLMAEFDRLPSATADATDGTPRLSAAPVRSSTSSRPTWLKAAAVLLLTGGGATLLISRSKSGAISAVVATNVRRVGTDSGASVDTGRTPLSKPPRTLPPVALSSFRLYDAERKGTRVDTIADIAVLTSTFEVSAGVEVTLEVTDAQTTATRGNSITAPPADTIGSFSSEGPVNTLTWYDARAKVTLRLVGRIGESELRALRARVTNR